MAALMEVTQADRVFAAQLFGKTDWSAAQFLEGKRDKDEKVQAFARHRLAHSEPRPVAGEGVERAIGGETVCGFRVAAYRETHPVDGAKYGHSYSEHWSTPNTRDPRVKVDRLFTETQLRAALVTHSPVAGEAREAAHLAAWNAIYGKEADPFQNPESFDFCGKIADAVLATHSPGPTEAGEVERIATIIRAYCQHGVKQEPFDGPLDTADLAALKIAAAPKVASDTATDRDASTHSQLPDA